MSFLRRKKSRNQKATRVKLRAENLENRNLMTGIAVGSELTDSPHETRDCWGVHDEETQTSHWVCVPDSFGTVQYLDVTESALGEGESERVDDFSESEEDQSLMGFKLNRTFVKSWSIAGDADDAPDDRDDDESIDEFGGG